MVQRVLLFSILVNLYAHGRDRSAYQPLLNDHLSCSQHEQDGRMHIIFFFGTRPEIIKLSPIIHRLKAEESVRVTSVFTGQQPSLIGPFLDYWKVNPDIHISGTMQTGQSLSMLISKLLSSIDSSIELCDSIDMRQLWVVQGDTSSAYAAGSVAYYRGIPVAHVEAGLRTYDMTSPFPEEFNRRSLALICSLHFAPTIHSQGNLLSQGVDPDRIFVTGNTGIDAVRLVQESIVAPELTTVVDSSFSINGRVNISNLVEQNKRIVLLTMHRRENKDTMPLFYAAIRAVACIKCVYIVPVHPNPASREAATAACRADVRMLCVEPLPYGATQFILRHSRFIMTDSGGLQEEATFYRKPVIVLRERTDRPEAVMAGQAILVEKVELPNDVHSSVIDFESIQKNIVRLLEVPDSALFKSMSAEAMPFGDGNASDIIVRAMIDTKNRPLFSKPLRMRDSSIMGKTATMNRIAPYCSVKGEHLILNCVIKDSVTVILTVYKRDTLGISLEAVLNQSMRPHHVFVVQNGDFLGDSVTSLINDFRRNNQDIPVDLVQFSSNSLFHGRFHIAYVMAKTEYVSIWDDDIKPSSGWLRGCIDQSQAHNDALIGGNAISFEYLMPKFAQTIPFSAVLNRRNGAKNDFVGLSWTLKREHLRYFFELAPFSYATGEDMQLSFALQMHGIESWHAQMENQTMNIRNIQSVYDDENAQHNIMSSSYIRQYLQCEILEAGFKPLACVNCDAPTIKRCLEYFKDKIYGSIGSDGFIDESKLMVEKVVEVFTS